MKMEVEVATTCNVGGEFFYCGDEIDHVHTSAAIFEFWPLVKFRHTKKSLFLIINVGTGMTATCYSDEFV